MVFLLWVILATLFISWVYYYTKSLLKLCEKGIIDKLRYEVKAGNRIFEVDGFFGENKGLVIAEVEINSEDEEFENLNC